MTPADYAPNFLISALVLSVVGVLVGWMFWRVAQRYGRTAVLGAWVGTSLLVTTLLVLQIHQRQAALEFSADQQARFPLFWWFLPMWLVALGAVALTVRRRLRAGGGPFSMRVAARSLGAMWLGLLAYFVAFAALDAAGVVR